MDQWASVKVVIESRLREYREKKFLKYFSFQMGSTCQYLLASIVANLWNVLRISTTFIYKRF
jgi:hypothetical protein